MNNETYKVIKNAGNFLATCFNGGPTGKDISPDMDCSMCSLVNYGLDCCNNRVNERADNYQDESYEETNKEADDPKASLPEMPDSVKCSECGHYLESKKHGHVKRRCGAFNPALMVPKNAKDCAPIWCPRRKPL